MAVCSTWRAPGVCRVANTRRVMSEWPNWWMQRLPETTDWGVDTVCGCLCHCLCLWVLSVARIRSGFVNNRVSFWIRDGGRQVFKTTERSGSASNAGCGAGYNAEHSVSLWGSAGWWSVMTACSHRGGWNNCWPSLCSGRGDIWNMRIVQQIWGGGVLSLDCRGYGTPSFRGISLASRYWNASLSWGKLRIPQRPMLLSFWGLGGFRTLCATRDVTGLVLCEGIIRHGSSRLRL